MKFHDITWMFSEDMVVFAGDPQIQIKEDKSITKGDLYNLSVLAFGSHAGTHVDAPKHFYDHGLTVDQLPLEAFIGKAKVFEITDKEAITLEDIKGLGIQQGDRVLFKTRNSTFLEKTSFQTDFTYITYEAGKYLAEIGIHTVGIDYLSVEKFDCTSPETHYVLLAAQIVILEGLDLRNIEPGEYEMIALPLKIKGGNGSPVRVVLIEKE